MGKQVDGQDSSAEDELARAVQALQSVTKACLTELKSFANPPKDVKVCLEGLGILMGLASLEWKDLKKLIGDSKIIDMMKGYDKDKVSPAIQSIQLIII